MDLPITEVVNISVSQAPTGIGQYNTSNIAAFTRETPGGGFGSAGYKIYLEPTEVITDFGSDSDTASMAVAIFSQQPNILQGGGYLVVIPFEDTTDVSEVQHLSFSLVPTTGTYKLNYNGNATSALAAGVTAANMQIALRLLAGLSSVTVTGSAAAGYDVTFAGVSGDALPLTVTENSTQSAGGFDVVPTIAVTVQGTTASTETLEEAITRTDDLVQYFGILAAEITDDDDILDAAALVQSMNKIAFFPSQLSASVTEGGILDLLRTGNLHKSRGLYYGSAAVLAKQVIPFTSVPTTGNYVLSYNGNSTSSLSSSTNAAALQVALRLLSGLSAVTVTGSTAIGFTVTFVGVSGAAELLVVVSNSLEDTGGNPVSIVPYTSVIGVSATEATTMALEMSAAYASLGMSTNFNGSNTTQTMNMKDLTGVQPDPSMTTTIFNLCKEAGADIYASVQGVPKVFSFGANDFFDNQYNLAWLVGALQVAGFNALATSATKLPQTENGMSILKGAYRKVCQQAVSNQFLAPGQWDSPVTFGNQADLLLNVAQRGYYIYSAPVSQQLPAVRADREAPLIQIAIKYAGAIHKSSVIVYVNA